MSNKIETIIMPSELTDEMAEVISERLRVCGGIADDIWEALKAAAPVVERKPDAIIEGVMTSCGISHAIYASTVSLKHGEQVKLYASPPAPVSVLPDNLLSHRNTWLQAMERLVELEPESCAPDEDEKGFWRHELEAMRDMYTDLDRLSTK